MKKKFLFMSDTHGKHRLLTSHYQSLVFDYYDYIVHAGDISNIGRKEEVEDFLLWFNSFNAKEKIFIAGNHDFLFEKDNDLARSLIPSGVTYLQDSGVTLGGVKFWGSPQTPRFFDWAFNRDRGDDIRKFWGMIPHDTDVLITHGPPFGVLDYVERSRKNAGCEELAHFVGNVVKPKVHVFGHIHEGRGMVEVEGGATFINASVLDDDYRLSCAPIVLEVEF